MSLRVHKIKTFTNNSHEISYHGTATDFTYISGRLKMEKDVETIERDSIDGVLLSMLAHGSAANPLSRERVIQILTDDPEIEVIDSAVQ